MNPTPCSPPGYLGQPLGGFPAELQSKVLKLGTSGAMSIVEGRPGADMPAFDFDAERVKLEKKWGKDPNAWLGPCPNPTPNPH